MSKLHGLEIWGRSTTISPRRRLVVLMVTPLHAPISGGWTTGEMDDLSAQALGRFAIGDTDDRGTGQFGLEDRLREIAVIIGQSAEDILDENPWRLMK